MTYEKCVATVSATLKERDFENHDKLAENMCTLWADENGYERQFGRTLDEGDKRRSFAISIGDPENLLSAESGDTETINFPVIAITAGPHEYDDDKAEIKQKVYIEPSILKDNIEAFKELPIYYNHQRTPEDLIGMATEPEVVEMENGKLGIKMNAAVSNKNERGKEVVEKVKQGDITHVSIDWLSNDVDVMGDTYATNIRPTEVSFIDNVAMDPVCKECTIETKCGLHTEDNHHDCGCGGKDGKCECEQEVINMAEEVKDKSEAENIVEREFASLRSKLEEANASQKELQNQYEEALKLIETFKIAEEERALAEAESRKVASIEAIISKELLFGTLDEVKKDTRVEELSAWDELKLTGFSEALAAMPEPASEEQRTFGKGKSNEGDAVPETEREFAVKIENGLVKLDPSKLKGD